MIRHVLACRLALQHAGRAGEEAEMVDDRRELFGLGHGVGLAGVLAHCVNELPGVGFDRVGDAQQRELALGGRRLAPTLKRSARGSKGAVDVLGPRNGRAGKRIAGGGIGQLDGLPALG